MDNDLEEELYMIKSFRIGHLVEVALSEEDVKLGTVNGLISLMDDMDYGIMLKGSANIYPAYTVNPVNLTDEMLYELELFSFDKGHWYFIDDSKITLENKLLEPLMLGPGEDVPLMVYSLSFAGNYVKDLFFVHELQDALFLLYGVFYSPEVD